MFTATCCRFSRCDAASSLTSRRVALRCSNGVLQGALAGTELAWPEAKFLKDDRDCSANRILFITIIAAEETWSAVCFGEFVVYPVSTGFTPTCW